MLLISDNSKPAAPVKHSQSSSSEYSSSAGSQDNSTDEESEESDLIVHAIPAEEPDPAKQKLLPKEIVCEILDERLSEIGIKSDCTGLSDSKYDDAHKQLEMNREKIEEV